MKEAKSKPCGSDKLMRSMMNKFFDILVISCFFICGACATSPREKRAEDMIETPAMQESELEAQFESEPMNSERLKAFEARAQQKLQDLADYVNMLKDPTLDSNFHQQAMRQALALFEDENDVAEEDAENEMMSRTMLKNLLDENEHISKFTIDSVQVVKPLQSAGKERYEGVLSFESNLITSQGTSVITPKEAVIVLKKVEKEFGNDRKLIWEVLLGKIH
jgi:hypothetical protein